METQERSIIRTRQKAYLRLWLLLIISLISFVTAIASGSLSLSLPEVFSALTSDTNPLHHQVIYELRVPRMIHAFTTGALLALAGALMQVLLRNPLADPYILGISGGSAVFALIAIALGFAGFTISVAAFLGALLAMFLVFGLARGQGSWTATRLLLTGVVLASGWGAIISFVLTIAPQGKLRSLIFWLMGDLSFAENFWPPLLTLGVGVLVCLYFARRLNVLSLGALQAQSLGLNTNQFRWQIYVVASLLTAMAIIQAGNIGFIGLIIPHLLRLIGLRDHRLLIPGAVLAGGSLLVFADTFARSAIEDTALPVGILTAAIGVPIFIVLLYRGVKSL
ncbi:MAG: iron ABC transporter permease [Thioalkalispiraceae bacterium]|jgi:iron complex transport system permease protein